jgi:hypothetical protein
MGAARVHVLAETRVEAAKLCARLRAAGSLTEPHSVLVRASSLFIVSDGPLLLRIVINPSTVMPWTPHINTTPIDVGLGDQCLAQ